MTQFSYTIQDELGLHARPASTFLRTATQFESGIILIKEDREYNGKSIISILAMAAKKDTLLTIRCIGTDEVEALSSLIHLVKNDLEI